VKGSFGDSPAKSGGGVTDPKVTQSLDEATATRVAAYAKAANAEYAIVGIVYRTGDQQLTAGTAIYSAKRNGFAALPAVSFDAEALTSNVEAYRLVEEVVKRAQNYGSTASLPLSLISKPLVKGGAVATSKEPEANPTGANRKPSLTPDTRTLDNKSTYVEGEVGPDEKPPEQPTISSGPPKWIWIIIGVAVVGGGVAGGYFGVTEATKPVTGTVNASWP
jgi:hypothetical protein